MSTIKSSNEHLTLNADGSSKDIKFQANGVQKASISSAGLFTSTTIDATKLTGDVPDASFPSTLPAASAANLTAIPAANITGTLPAISGANLTGITTGKVIQMNNKASAATTFNNGSGTVTLDTLAFSNAHTSGNGVFIGYPIQTYTTSADTSDAWLYFKVFDGSTELDSQGRYYFASGAVGYNNMYACCVFPNISSTATLTVKITAATNGSFSQVINGQDNCKGFFIQEIDDG